MLNLKKIYPKHTEISKKAYNLSKLIYKGFNIPRGYYISNKDFFDKNYEYPKKFKKIAIRSAGNCEDSLNNSFAGIFKSFLNVTEIEFEDKLKEVYNSFFSKRANLYKKLKNIDIEPGIIIQEMIESEYSAILFFNKNSISLEFAKGYCDNITSGKIITNNITGYENIIKHETLKKLNFKEFLDKLLSYLKEENINENITIDMEITYSKNKWYILQYRKLIDI